MDSDTSDDAKAIVKAIERLRETMIGLAAICIAWGFGRWIAEVTSGSPSAVTAPAEVR